MYKIPEGTRSIPVSDKVLKLLTRVGTVFGGGSETLTFTTTGAKKGQVLLKAPGNQVFSACSLEFSIVKELASVENAETKIGMNLVQPECREAVEELKAALDNGRTFTVNLRSFKL